MKTFREARDELGYFDRFELLYTKEVSKNTKEFSQRFIKGNQYFDVVYTDVKGVTTLTSVTNIKDLL